CPLCFFSSRRRHTRSKRDWSSDECSSDLSKTKALAMFIRCLCPPENSCGCLFAKFLFKPTISSISFVFFFLDSLLPTLCIFKGSDRKIVVFVLFIYVVTFGLH